MSNGRATLGTLADPSALEMPSAELPPGADRRTEPRFTPSDLEHRIIARHKSGELVTLLDLSAGGVQFETPRLIRPDADVVLEIVNSRTREVAQAVSRVLRATVAGLGGGGITYRAACAFKRPLSHPVLLLPPSAARSDGPDSLALEFRLKAIVESYLKRPAGAAAASRTSDASSLLDALARLRSAAEGRRDPIDRQLGVLLTAMIPALQRREPSDALRRTLFDHLADELPLLEFRPSHTPGGLVHGCERVIVDVSIDSNPAPMSITAEFPPGCGPDPSQLRLLKLSAYLVGLLDNWNTDVSTDAPAALMAPEPEQPAAPPLAAETDACSDLPLGWNRVVLRHIDGQVLRGYSNDFFPERAYLQFSPRIDCPAAERMLVPIARLKALFFVKDFQGDPNRVDGHTFDQAYRGRKVQVTFRDGEVMTGSTLSYKPKDQGFFVTPAAAGGNNLRAYVVTSAIRHLRFV
ncbi:MAG: DUF6982 domain-containing protein [Vicinamibacterales bacterium]